jgi:hypothetical protein
MTTLLWRFLAKGYAQESENGRLSSQRNWKKLSSVNT